jgi:glutamate-5-semialdehyde dehydrogenase
MRIREQLENCVLASRKLQMVSAEEINAILKDLAFETEKGSNFILAENRKDLESMDPGDPKFDRLKLTDERLLGIAAEIRNVSALPSPVGRVLSETVRPNGLHITRISVPFGVIGIIYEARPNVTFDVFSLCLKSGNVCVLKGGSDAIHSNTAIVKVIHTVLEHHGVDCAVVTLLPAGREETQEMMQARDYIDLIIPRGSQSLIDFVRDNARVPVIETGAGICHTFFDSEGDVQKGATIVLNAKTRRPSVCNALDCLVIHQERLTDLPFLMAPLAEKEVIVYADQEAFKVLASYYPANLLEHASESSFGTEFLSLKMAIKTAGTFDAALEHIARYSSGHSEAIITENPDAAEKFLKLVDAAAVYVNASTAFTDGAQFGLGAEIGISTQKLHARGPMALEAMTTYKWIVKGDGHVRPV